MLGVFGGLEIYPDKDPELATIEAAVVWLVAEGVAKSSQERVEPRRAAAC